MNRRADDGIDTDDNSFASGRPVWLDRLGRVRNVVRQEMISRQLDRHLPSRPVRVLDVGAGQGTQSIRMARLGHSVVAVEPDAEMRAQLLAALDDETEDVRERVALRDASLNDLGRVLGDEGFDVVLLMGVLMYLPSSTSVIPALASHVADGGILALSIRTPTSAVWRPAARQDWQSALAAFEEFDRSHSDLRDMRYVNEIGAEARADDLDALVALAAANGLHLENWYGVRIAVDTEERDPAPPTEPGELAALFDVEEPLGPVDPYRRLGQLAHLILRRPRVALGSDFGQSH